MSQNVPKKRRSVKAALRRSKVIALSVEGKTNQQIADCLKVNEKTIDRDMQSAQVQDYVHDLVRRQMQDIEGAELPMRLSFRGDLLDKLLPKRAGEKVEVNVNANATSTNESTVKLLSEYDAIIAAEVAKEKSNIRKDDSEEQVHSS